MKTFNEMCSEIMEAHHAADDITVDMVREYAKDEGLELSDVQARKLAPTLKSVARSFNPRFGLHSFTSKQFRSLAKEVLDLDVPPNKTPENLSEWQYEDAKILASISRNATLVSDPEGGHMIRYVNTRGQGRRDYVLKIYKAINKSLIRV